MIGALIGDIVGSVYEFNNIKTKEFPLLGANSHFTDDSVMTLAVAEIMQKGYMTDSGKITATFRKWGKNFINAGYGERFIRWLLSENPQPYGSYGNGAAMRVSPVAWYSDSAGEVKEYARAVTQVTHNHPEGLKGAEVTAMCVYYARVGYTKESIRKYAEQYYDLDFDYDKLRKSNFHDDESCQKTVPQAIFCFLVSKSFEDCLRTAVAIGGDCDTICAIAGSIAEAYYRNIDRELMLNALSRLPAETNGCYTLQILSNYAARKKFLLEAVIELTRESLKNISPKDVKALKMAEPGAMGKPGEIYIMAGKNESIRKYHGNITDLTGAVKNVEQKSCEIKKLLDIKAPEFVEIYMGAGNFLYISKDLQPAFEKAVQGMSPSQIYLHYKSIIWRLLQR